jgi:hypothetical protein
MNSVSCGERLSDTREYWKILYAVMKTLSASAVIDKIGGELFGKRGCTADRWRLPTNVLRLLRVVRYVEVIE